MTPCYNDYSSFIKKRFGERVQKISIDAGFTCPNRDGSKSTGGCIYCDNAAFNPAYASRSKSITDQLQEGIAYFSEKYPSQKYIAYFQSFTNTYAPVQTVKEKIEEALSCKGVAGVSVATRPDCISDEILEMLAGFNKRHFITVEYGVESTYDSTLKTINRCHSWNDSIQAIRKTAFFGLYCGVHLIIGLPGETEADFLNHAVNISRLPVNFLKLHQLQILSGTTAEKLFSEKPELFTILSVDEYSDLMCSFVARLHPDIVIERFTGESPPERVIAPRWNKIKNFEVTEIIRRKLTERNIRQGIDYPALRP
jgi:hypothetical protein